MKQITKVRKAVCAMANQLRKAGYSLKDAFKKAWQRVKLSMTVRAAGTTFENRQERLAFLQQFKPEDLTVTLEREKENKFDRVTPYIVYISKPISRRTIIWIYPQRACKGAFQSALIWYSGLKATGDADYRRLWMERESWAPLD